MDFSPAALLFLGGTFAVGGILGGAWLVSLVEPKQRPRRGNKSNR